MVCIYISSHSLKAEKLFPVIIYVNGIILRRRRQRPGMRYENCLHAIGSITFKFPLVIMLSLIGPSSSVRPSVRQGSEGIDFRLNGVTISADSSTFCSYAALNNIT